MNEPKAVAEARVSLEMAEEFCPEPGLEQDLYKALKALIEYYDQTQGAKMSEPTAVKIARELTARKIEIAINETEFVKIETALANLLAEYDKMMEGPRVEVYMKYATKNNVICDFKFIREGRKPGIYVRVPEEG